MLNLRERIIDEWILKGRRLRVKKVFRVHVVTDAEHYEALKELRDFVRLEFVFG